MTRAGAPLGALLRLSPKPFGDGSAPGRACVSRCHPGRQRAPRAGVLVPQGGPRSRPSAGVTSPSPQAPHKLVSGCPNTCPGTAWPDLRPRIPLAPSSERHRLTPLNEQGAERIRPVLRAGITFFERVIPADVNRRAAKLVPAQRGTKRARHSAKSRARCALPCPYSLIRSSRRSRVICPTSVNAVANSVSVSLSIRRSNVVRMDSADVWRRTQTMNGKPNLRA
jgi:hypothetical protein